MFERVRPGCKVLRGGGGAGSQPSTQIHHPSQTPNLLGGVDDNLSRLPAVRPKDGSARGICVWFLVHGYSPGANIQKRRMASRPLSG